MFIVSYSQTEAIDLFLNIHSDNLFLFIVDMLFTIRS